MGQKSQAGSVLGFIIGGVLLAFLLIAGVYFVHRQSEASRPAPVLPVQPSPEPTSTPSPSPTPAPERPPAQNPPSSEPAQLPGATPRPAVPQQIPQTGPAEMGASMVGAALLVGAAISYLRSRRQRASL